ncbi:replication-associated recombination protein A [Desulfotomaculum copahuensis]|uniref:Replication-associated recombination protein A n=1 Tax=Desulfotomaculum copahuensis TaxID=1838280 RepID=A0A1B7LGB6_9FIRM|nr:replication-associated recombination protein A [Desulfotomaculum copahuensis]OAT85009.1 AAA family ATPase [Desulfotomaculum copahuensis]
MAEDLFQQALQDNLHREAPLAGRMRPRRLEDFEEQNAVVGPGTPLRRAIEADRLQSIILYGPPGTGKTTLARVIARMTKSHFVTINAVTAGVADIRKVIQEAADRRAYQGRKTVLFIDEIHRFNKAQQDALLPSVENGLITLIGSTTENPMFAVNRPLLSRSRLYRLEPLTEAAIERILRRALADEEHGLGAYRVEMEPAALSHLARSANGDARAALNALELAVLTTPPGADGVRRIDLSVAGQAAGRRALQYDRADEHYDVISAFIKSMRGSDPQATLYWLARLIYAGEDPAFISRRIMIHAAEDVGLADPRALLVATAAAQAAERIGWPEARIVLAEAALYIARAPKSNSVVTGIDRAMRAVEKERAGAVPAHLRDASYAGAAALGHGKGYKYPHDYPGHRVVQQYLPDELVGMVFYEPSDQGEERKNHEHFTGD